MGLNRTLNLILNVLGGTLNHFDDDDIVFTTEVWLVTHVIQQNLLEAGIPNSGHIRNDLLQNLYKNINSLRIPLIGENHVQIGQCQ